MPRLEPRHAVRRERRSMASKWTPLGQREAVPAAECLARRRWRVAAKALDCDLATRSLSPNHGVDRRHSPRSDSNPHRRGAAARGSVQQSFYDASSSSAAVAKYSARRRRNLIIRNLIIFRPIENGSAEPFPANDLVWQARTRTEASRKWPTRSCAAATTVDTKSTSATRRCASKSTPATRPSRFSSRPDYETHAEERRRFAILNLPRHLSARPSEETLDARNRRIDDMAFDHATRVVTRRALPGLPYRDSGLVQDSFFDR